MSVRNGAVAPARALDHVAPAPYAHETARSGRVTGGACAMLVADADLRVLDARGPALTERGYEPDRWPGRPLAQVLHPRAWVALEPYCRAALAGEHQSFRYRTSDGERDVQVQMVPLPGAGGLAVTLHDISEELEAVRELELSERRRHRATALFEQAFDAAPVAMALTSPVDGRYLRVNDAMVTLLRRSRQELMSLSVGEVTHPEDRAGDADGIQALRDGAGEYHVEKRYVRGDGSDVWAAVHVAPIRNPDGSVVAFFAQKIDITQAKEREAQTARFVADAEWLGRIRDALDEDRLMLYAQPIVDLWTGEVVQRELLLRMRDRDGSVIAPGEFLPVAERYGLIAEIDRWVIRQAVRLAASAPVEFNLSAASIADPDVLRELTEAVTSSDIDPANLVVEVTETAMMDQAQAGARFAEQVRELGCQLALDDFGTGFSGLGYLRHLHAEQLKIDIEFVRELVGSETDQRLVRGIVGLAREFHQTTTAEGIEDEQTLVMLRELGVERGQGYLFARPAPVGADERPAEAGTRPEPAGGDPVTTVTAAFDALARRDLAAAQRLCHPDVVLQPFQTARLAERHEPYRGAEGVRQYLRDVAAVWEELDLTATAFCPANGAVVVFGHAEGRADGVTVRDETLWVFRLRDGLIAGIDAYRQPSRPQASVGG